VEGGFQRGQKVWVMLDDGGQRAAVYVGEDENPSWLGGTPRAYVVFEDDNSRGEVRLDTVVPRDD
jgi:hypothetical protein